MGSLEPQKFKRYMCGLYASSLNSVKLSYTVVAFWKSSLSLVDYIKKKIFHLNMAKFNEFNLKNIQQA